MNPYALLAGSMLCFFVAILISGATTLPDMKYHFALALMSSGLVLFFMSFAILMNAGLLLIMC